MMTFSYDDFGTVTATDATGRETIYKYGSGGEPAKIIDGNGNITRYGI